MIMDFRPNRRTTLGLGLAALFANVATAAASGLKLGPPKPFSFEALIEQARAAAKAPYTAPAVQNAAILEKIDYDAFQDIRFRRDRMIWADKAHPVQLFHPGRYFKSPVRMHVIENAQAREIEYEADLFDFGPKAQMAKGLSPDQGFAGFRIMDTKGPTDWLAFLGASYFRSAGELNQYGLSARGLAIDTAMPGGEEFPRFTHFYLDEQPSALIIHARLDSPSVTGAYRITAAKGEKIFTDVEARIFARKDVARLGAAPLTSMFWYSETLRRDGLDWRPEIHDSDGLAMWTGAGERLWRPLNNPPQVMTNSFVDKDVKGFGLMQRDRNFENYQDDGVFYEKRPSVWVEPKGAWGEGAVQLVEIPTQDEIMDNIVAYWVPAKPVKQGDELAFDYRLHWAKDDPFPAPIGHVVATRRGRGGVPGQPATYEAGLVKYAIDFEGGNLESYSDADKLKPMITASHGEIVNPYALSVKGTNRWRMVFDLRAAGAEPVDLRAFLQKQTGEALTETWIAQHFG
jgi:periplasmic glucans biosynthesis protein